MRIMIADDDQMILNGFVAIIKKIDSVKCDVITAFDGQEALEKLNGVGADLTITDINMPGMSGLELIREAKAKNLCNRFVILTGYEEFEYARQAIRYQVRDYLLKPINKDELTEIILRTDRELNGDVSGIRERILPDIDICRRNIDIEKCSESLGKILNYIEANYRHDLSLDRLSELFKLHPNYICSLFSRELNMTFLFYLDSIRVRKSIEMLIYEDNIIIRDIAVMVGFLGERQFYKVFKKMTGTTPGEFKKIYGNINFGQ